jgi:hypothetical protein
VVSVLARRWDLMLGCVCDLFGLVVMRGWSVILSFWSAILWSSLYWIFGKAQ